MTHRAHKALTLPDLAHDYWGRSLGCRRDNTQPRAIKAYGFDRQRLLLSRCWGVVHIATDTKVGEQNRAIGLDEQVAGFQVALQMYEH